MPQLKKLNKTILNFNPYLVLFSIALYSLPSSQYELLNLAFYVYLAKLQALFKLSKQMPSLNSKEIGTLPFIDTFPYAVSRGRNTYAILTNPVSTLHLEQSLAVGSIRGGIRAYMSTAFIISRQTTIIEVNPAEYSQFLSP